MTTPELAPSGPACSLCGVAASPTVWLGHWQRRLTPAEVAVEQAKEQTRRDKLIELADPQKPPPYFAPLPDCADWTRIVFGCMVHAITKDTAALVHQATCTAPGAELPGCNCEPEAPPKGQPEAAAAELPAGW